MKKSLPRILFVEEAKDFQRIQSAGRQLADLHLHYEEQPVLEGAQSVEWIFDCYQVTVDKKSGICNDPNDWAREHNKPRYILDLLLSVMTVSLKTQEIVAGLPDVKFE